MPYEVLKDYLLTLLSYLAYAPNLKRVTLEQSAKTKFPEMARGFMTIAETLKREGRREGRRETLADVSISLLQQLLGSLDEETQTQISSLSLKRLERLSKNLLDFRSQEQLTAWLERGTALKP